MTHKNSITLGLISDTHGRMRQEALDALQDCDVILHAGDIGDQKILDMLESIAPTYAVLGNNDRPSDYPNLTYQFKTTLADVTIQMVHKPKSIKTCDEDLIIFGHTHVPENREVNSTRFINPGCIHRPRDKKGRSVAKVYLENGQIKDIQFTYFQ